MWQELFIFFLRNSFMWVSYGDHSGQLFRVISFCAILSKLVWNLKKREHNEVPGSVAGFLLKWWMMIDIDLHDANCKGFAGEKKHSKFKHTSVWLILP